MPKVTLELPELPKGWEYTKEYRIPRIGEYYAYGEEVEDRDAINKASNLNQDNWFIIRKIKWRATQDETFYFVTPWLEVRAAQDSSSHIDLWSVGNYFRTEVEAQDVADAFKGCLDILDKN